MMEWSQRGVALITALLVVAVVTIAAVAMSSRQYMDIRRTANVIDLDRAYLFALGAETWAGQVLLRDKTDVDDLSEDWAVVLPPLTVEGAQLAGRLEDMQGRFNLNNLVVNGKPSQLDVERFKRLLTALGLEPSLATAVVDWLDSDAEPQFPDGAEDAEYMAATVPYRAANRLMTSPSELLAVRGFTADIYEKLRPYVTALPEHADINVNTAPAPVLMALGDGMTQSDAESLTEKRKDKSYGKVDDFIAEPVWAGHGIKRDGLSVNSRYFLMQADAGFGRSQVRLYSLLSRKSNAMQIVMRAQGVY